MVLALHEVLDRHLAATDPQVLSGHGRLGNEVRWVHSSEIFEIGPLLSGGNSCSPQDSDWRAPTPVRAVTTSASSPLATSPVWQWNWAEPSTRFLTR